MHSTKAEILRIIKRYGAASVDDLAAQLGFAGVTVRQHLLALQRDALVEVRANRRGPGRPCMLYALTERGDATFIRGGEDLARGILSEVALLEPAELTGLAPAEKVALVLSRRALRAAAPYIAQLQAYAFSERATRAVAILQEMSGFVEVEAQPAGVAIRDMNCAYRRLADAGTFVCVWHARFLTELLGCEVCWEASGDDNGCCSFFVATPPALPGRAADSITTTGSTQWLEQRQA